MVRRQAEVTAMDELGAIAEDRSRIYWLLAGFYLEAPQPELLDRLRAVPVDDAAPDDELAPLLAALRDSLADETEPEALHRDYSRLFLGLREGYGLPPPYESLYLEGRLLGESTEDVMDHFRRSGISLAQESAGPEDHLGLELKFLSLLCLRESQAWRHGYREQGHGCLAAQRDFLAEHLRQWAPDYCRKVAAEARTGFYRNVAALTAAAIAADSRQVTDMLESFSPSEANKTNQGGLQ
jgi:TorA maturation chaperone TorD